MDWQKFKNKKIAVRVTTEKEKFFSECAKREIYNFLNDRAMLRDIYVCRLCYKDQFSDGRYELMSVDEWQVKENGLFGKQGLEIIEYKS